ncbi:MAG: molybdopterin molybdotransferase MoeA [Cytophagales bacterium]|nr:molybdopterin molybdotransferase MoeA [Cytophagales bacterium]
MIETQEAKNIISAVISCRTLPERKTVINAINHALSEDIFSPIHMPPFRQSAMDGYALRLHEDSAYKIVGEARAGDFRSFELQAGEAVRIFTGASVPDTADTVVMQEKTSREGDRMHLPAPAARGENIRLPGEQIKKGALALRKGTLLTPAGAGYLSSLGITEAMVFRKPSVAILSTGNELFEPGAELPRGKVYESNSSMLLSALISQGFSDVSLHKVPDDYTGTAEALDGIIGEKDMVLASGGISVGDYDFVGKALRELQVTQHFYRVRQKPGKPLYFGQKGNTFLFALPGNPAAALSCFYIYVYPALQKMSGIKNFELVRSFEQSASSFVKKGDRAQFLKAFCGNGKVSLLEGQSSAMLHTFALANALAFVPAGTKKIAEGDLLEVIHLPL